MKPETLARQRECLLALEQEGLTFQEARDRMGYSYLGMRKMCQRHGIVFPVAPCLSSVATQRREATLRELASLNVTLRQASEMLGLNLLSLRVFCSTRGIKFYRAHSGAAAKRGQEMFRLYEQGYTLQQIGTLHGLTRERVRQLIAKFGKTGVDGGQAVASKARAAVRRAAKERKYLAKHGCTVAQWRELRAIGHRMVSEGAGRDQTPLGAFIRHRKNSRYRGVGWELSLWQWWTIWQDSGKWNQRGRFKDGYVMARYAGSGPYAPGNVFICTQSENSSLGQVTKKMRKLSAPAPKAERVA